MNGLVRPRALAFRGRVHAVGLVFDSDDARERALASWCDGARLHRVGDGLFVLFPSPRTIDVSAAEGAPVLASSGALHVVPLTDRERLALDPAPGVLVRAVGGIAATVAIGEEVDPATWLDVSELVFEPPSTVIHAPTQITRLRAVDEAGVRAELAKAVGPLAGAREAVKASLAKAYGGHGAPGSGDLLARIGSGLRALGVALVSTSWTLSVPQARTTSRGSVWPPLGRWLRRVVTKILLEIRLGRLLERAHAEYLTKMLDAFDRGDLDEALRCAIPLGSGSGDGTVALLPPRPRTALTIGFSRSRGGSIPVVEDMYAHLRSTYRTAFAQLDRAGDVDRAAFVLEELLHATREAVAYLERHKRYASAAKLAESRKVDADWVVRLWFLAGDKDRAVALARASGCFALAVERLRRTDTAAAADALQLLWADTLATGGDFARAVEIAWPITSARDVVRAWVERAIVASDVSEAAVLMRKLALDPDDFVRVRDRARSFLDDESPAGAAARRALLGSLAASRDAAAQPIVRHAVRSVAADEHAPGQLLVKLARAAGDALLSIDAGRPVSSFVRAPPRGGVSDHTRAAFEGGMSPVLDLARVARGRLLVALGERGVRLLAPDGRLLATFVEPADAIVASHHGDRALAVRRHGETVDVMRIDVAARRIAYWGTFRVDCFASTFDGSDWYVARGDTVLALDATSDLHRTVWSVDTQSAVVAIDVGESALALTTGSGDEREGWLYSLPRRVLQKRDRFGAAAAFATGGLIIARELDGVVAYVWRRGKEAEVVLAEDALPLERAAVRIGATAYCLETTLGETAVLRMGPVLERAQPPTATVRLGGVARAQVRLDGRFVCIGDARGRLLVVDAVTGAVAQEMRV